MTWTLPRLWQEQAMSSSSLRLQLIGMLGRTLENGDWLV